MPILSDIKAITSGNNPKIVAEIFNLFFNEMVNWMMANGIIRNLKTPTTNIRDGAIGRVASYSLKRLPHKLNMLSTMKYMTKKLTNDFFIIAP